MASDSVWLPGRIEVSSGGARNAEQFRKQESWPAAPPPSDSGDHPLSPTPLRRGHRAPRLPSLGDPGVWPPSPPHRKSVCPVPFLPRVRKFQTSRPSSLRMRVLGPWNPPSSALNQLSSQPHSPPRPLASGGSDLIWDPDSSCPKVRRQARPTLRRAALLYTPTPRPQHLRGRWSRLQDAPFLHLRLSGTPEAAKAIGRHPPSALPPRARWGWYPAGLPARAHSGPGRSDGVSEGGTRTGSGSER